jgi:hypothetical protein
LKLCNEEQTLIKIIEFYDKCDWRSVVSLKTHLSYAWEHDKKSLFYNKLEQGLEETNVLVVIGYSFPFFNREVDKLMLCNYMPHLRKVYFQDMNPDNIAERFMAINEDVPVDNLIPIRDIYQFYFPNEL